MDNDDRRVAELASDLRRVERQVRALERLVIGLLAAVALTLGAIFIPEVRLAVGFAAMVALIALCALGFIGGIMALLGAAQRRSPREPEGSPGPPAPLP